MFSLLSRRWFSIKKNQLVYQKKFKVHFTINVAIFHAFNYDFNSETKNIMLVCFSGPAHGGGGGPASVHGEAQRGEREALLL